MNSTDGRSSPLPDRILEASLDLLRRSDQPYTIPIQGQSMMPLIQDGDQLLVVPGASGIGRGDVIVFQQGNQLFAHRVLIRRYEAAGPMVLTKGDNMLLPDPVVPLHQVMGRVSMIRREGRQMSLDTAGWRRLGYVIAVIMLIWSRLFVQVQTLKRRLGASGPNPLTVHLDNLIRTCFQLLLKISQRFFARWQG